MGLYQHPTTLFFLFYQEYIRNKSMQLPVFLVSCCHGRISSSSLLPTSVYSKKGKTTFVLKHWAKFWLNTVLWWTRAGKEQAQPEVPVKEIELLECPCMHVLSGGCLMPWKESGCASSMMHLEICIDRPQKYGVAYSCSCVLLVLLWSLVAAFLSRSHRLQDVLTWALRISIPKTIGNRKRDCAWGGSGW